MLHGELLIPVVQEVLVIMKLVGTVPSSRWPVCIIFCPQMLWFATFHWLQVYDYLGRYPLIDWL